MLVPAALSPQDSNLTLKGMTDLDLNSDSATYQLCDLGECPQLLFKHEFASTLVVSMNQKIGIKSLAWRLHVAGA
jgi:hypothetical protein